MDDDKLINLVYKNRCLWNRNERGYHNRALARQKWNMISKEMNSDAGLVKARWRGLRDTFRKEYYSRPISGSEGAPKKTTWIYFGTLMFLKNQIVPRKLQNSMPSTAKPCVEVKKDCQEMESEEECIAEQQFPEQEDTDEWQQTSTSPIQQLESSRGVKPLKPTKVMEKPLEIEQCKLPAFQCKIETVENDPLKSDSDYYFLMSLLPYLQQVPPSQKLLVRMKLEQVLSETHVLGHHGSDSQPMVYNSNPSSVNSSDQEL